MVRKMNRRSYKLKGCPRCGGDLLCDAVYEDFEEVCLQCGHRNYLDNRQNSGLQKTIDLIDLPDKAAKISETTGVAREFELSGTFAGTGNLSHYTTEAERFVKKQDGIEAREKTLPAADEAKRTVATELTAWGKTHNEGAKVNGRIDTESCIKYLESILSLNIAREQSQDIKKHLEEIERIANELKTLKIGTEEAIQRLRRISAEVR